MVCGMNSENQMVETSCQIEVMQKIDIIFKQQYLIFKPLHLTHTYFIFHTIEIASRIIYTKMMIVTNYRIAPLLVCVHNMVQVTKQWKNDID